MENEYMATCRELVRRVLAKRGWQLVEDEEAFVAEVWQELQRRLKLIGGATNRPLAKIIEDATINRYNHLRYAACGDKGTFRQQQAFTELYNELLPLALFQAKYNTSIAQEGLQEGLVKLWRSLEQVHDPGAFSRWATVTVTREVKRRLMRDVNSPEISETDLSRNGETEEGIFDTKDGVSPPPQELSTDLEDIRNKVKSAIQDCLRRSQQRQNVMIKRFLEEKKVGEISQEMGIPAARVSRLINRSIEVLRNCQKMLKLNREMLSNELEKRGEA